MVSFTSVDSAEMASRALFDATCRCVDSRTRSPALDMYCTTLRSTKSWPWGSTSSRIWLWIWAAVFPSTSPMIRTTVTSPRFSTSSIDMCLSLLVGSDADLDLHAVFRLGDLHGQTFPVERRVGFAVDPHVGERD